MNRVAVAVAAAAALMLAGAGVATAQDPEPEPACAEALAAFNDARAAHIAALDADKAAAAAEAAADALGAAERDVDSKETAARELLASSAPTQATLDALREVHLPAAERALDDARESGDQAAINEAIRKVNEEKAKISAIEVLLEAQAVRDEAADAAEAAGDPVTLQATANETDAAALGEARQAAGLKAEDICGADVPDDPAGPVDVLDCVDFGDRAAAQAKLDEDRTDPNGLDVDGDGLACENIEYEDGVPGAPPAVDNGGAQVPVIPAEAPNTGGGPA